jgi:adenylate cyclase
MGDIFALLDDVAACIAGTLVAHVNKAERERVMRQGLSNTKAYDLYLRALDVSRMWDKHDAAVAERCLQQAVELEPSLGVAHAALSYYLTSRWLEPKDAGWRDPALLDKACLTARIAVERDPNLPVAHGALAWVLCWQHKLDAAVACCRRARQLNPGFADGRRGHVLCIAGEPDEGMSELLKVRLLDPFHPPMLLGWIGHCQLMQGKPAEALAMLRECTTRAPGWRPGHLWRAAACAQLRLDPEASTAAAEVIAIDPGFRISAWQDLHGYRDTARAEVIASNMRRAGLHD